MKRPGDETGAEAWYVAEGKRAQQLLDRGETRQATDLFEAVLARLGDAPSYGRAVILERLGRCLHVGGQPDLALAPLRDALNVLGTLAPSDAVKGLRGTLRSELGDALTAVGQHDDAKKAYEAALKIAEESKDLRAQAIELGRLGALALTEGDTEEGVRRYRAALSLCQRLNDPASEAAAWYQLARAFQQREAWNDAERHYREGVRIDRLIGNGARLGRHLGTLADMLQNRPDRLTEARQLAEEALGLAQAYDPLASDVWRNFGIVAAVIEKEAVTAADEQQRASLERQARHHRHLQEYAPRILAALARLGNEPSVGRAVILERLGCCLHMSGRPDVAVGPFAEGIAVTGRLSATDGVEGLRGTLHLDLGDALRDLGQQNDAHTAYEVALKIAEDLQDIRGQAMASQQLGRVFEEQPQRVSGDVPPSAFEITLHDDLLTDYAFEADLLVEGRRERRITRWTGEPESLTDDTRPLLAPGARTWIDDLGAVRFSLPLGEPVVERASACTVMRRTRREVAIAGHANTLWQLVRRMDGTATTAEIRSEIAPGERDVADRLLAGLAATGVVDSSGRAFGRFLHTATKKGVLPAGGLEGDAVLRLATDGSYRAYPDAPRIPVSQTVPERLRAFQTLTQARRSRRDYAGLALRRDDFDALLSAACGVTGAMPWGGRELKLRAYPSSGALYAVEIYPVVLRVEGLEDAVYHYRADENVLEMLRRIDRARFVAAALPVEREMVAGAAAMICLTGVFPRHERKYGEGGYRMMVAEAGHISQNLVLAATALGLSARPFGGVFDDLLNHDLGLVGSEEQFLLAVLVGRGSLDPHP